MPIPLLEPSERETVRRIRRRVQALEGVRWCEVRISFTGKKPQVRLRVALDDNPDYERIHRVSSRIDREVRSIVPDARVSIRSEPEAGAKGDNERVWALVKKIAEDEPGSRGAHNVHLQNLGGKLGVDFHLEVSAGMNVLQAHEVATRIEKKLKAANPKISEVVIHEETTSDRVSSERSGHGTELRWYIEHVAKRFPELRLARPPVVRVVGDNQLHVIIRAAFSPAMSMATANQVTSRIEAAIKDGYPGIVRVDIVHEPAKDGANSSQTDPAHA